MSKNCGEFKKGLWISSLLFIINGGLILAIIKRKTDFNVVIPILVVVLLVDQWSVDRKYLSYVAAPSKYYAADAVTRYTKKDNGLFRVCPINYERGNSGYFQYHNILTVSGLGPNPPKRYQDFIGAGSSVMFTVKNFFKYPYLLSMLNVKYVIGPNLPEDLSGYNTQVKKIVEEFREFYSNFRPAFVTRKYRVLENTNFLPRFSLMYSFEVLDSAEEVLDRILSAGFKPGESVLLEDSPGFSVLEGEGELKIVRDIANERILDVKTDKRAFLIVRENCHPHWKCYIDGEQEKIYKANYVFYGVFVPEGEHEIRFVYESRIFNIISMFSLIGFIIFLVSLVVYVKVKGDR
jgi:hypothetical protein